MSGFVIYRGPSKLDPTSEVMVIVTGIDAVSRNAKTGAMVQTWVLRADMHPAEALASGADDAICGECRHRPSETGRSCYVNPMGPGAVWRAYRKGNYREASPVHVAPLLRGRQVRLGAYGDPAAVPVAVWERLLRFAEGWTGYTHQWRQAPEFRGLAMASTDTLKETFEAHEAGWRTFRVRAVNAGGVAESLLNSEISCPASVEAGKRVTCEVCGLCRGASRPAKSIAIIDHSMAALWKRGLAGKRSLPVLPA